MKKMKKLLLVTLVLCMIFSVPVAAKGKKKLAYDDYSNIYWEYFNGVIFTNSPDTAEEVDPLVRHWFTNMGSSYYWKINAYVYDMDKDGVYECIITYPTSKTNWRKNGVEFWSCDKNNRPYKLKSPKITDAYAFKTSYGGNVIMNNRARNKRGYYYKKGVIVYRQKNKNYSYCQVFEKKGNTIKAKEKYVDKVTKKKGKTIHTYYKNSKKISKSTYNKWTKLACWEMPDDFGYGGL